LLELILGWRSSEEIPMKLLPSVGVWLVLAFTSIGLVAVTPRKVEAQRYHWYWWQSYPYYWSRGYNPYYTYSPYTNWYGTYGGYYGSYPYYNWTRTYPWGWYW